MKVPPHPLPSISKARLALALGLALGLLLLTLAGCALLKPTPAPDPLADYRASLRPGFELSPGRLDTLLRYSITVRIEPEKRAYTGTADIMVPITGNLATDELYFRLYPNLPQFLGSMEVNTVRVNGLTVNYGYAADGTAVHIVLPSPLENGTNADIRLGFSAKAPRHNEGAYAIFGLSEDVLNLTNFYPILAPRRGSEWALDLADPQGDVGFHDAALYRVDVTTPAEQVLVSSGTVSGTQPADNGWITTRFVQGPSREFTLLMSSRFQVEEADAYGTRVRSFFLPEDAPVARTALYAAVASLQIYSDVFGRYPYREMSVVQAPLTFHGMEFPGLNLIGSQTYRQHKKDLEMLVVHEVAHQWWYNQVGSDQIEAPWLDEGLAEFSMYYYYAYRYGVPIAERLRKSRWATPVQVAIDNELDAPIGYPVKHYKGNYETIVYAKGALFFAALRDELGADSFQQVLRAYLDRFSWQIATPAEFRALAEEVSGRDLGGMFREWVEGT